MRTTFFARRRRNRRGSPTRGVESLIARNALALRIAANGRIGEQRAACSDVQQSLTVTPAVAQQFRARGRERAEALRSRNGARDAAASARRAGRHRPADPARRRGACLSRRRGRRNGDRHACRRRTCARRRLTPPRTSRRSSCATATNELPIVPKPALRIGEGKFAMTRWPVANGQLEMIVGTKIPDDHDRRPAAAAAARS